MPAPKSKEKLATASLEPSDIEFASELRVQLHPSVPAHEFLLELEAMWREGQKRWESDPTGDDSAFTVVMVAHLKALRNLVNASAVLSHSQQWAVRTMVMEVARPTRSIDTMRGMAELCLLPIATFINSCRDVDAAGD